MAARKPALARTTYAADVLDDFTWGLDLGPVQQIPANGVALARDVDFSARGGFTQRCGIVPFDYATPKVGDQVYVMGTHNRVEDGLQQVFGLTGLAAADGSQPTTLTYSISARSSALAVVRSVWWVQRLTVSLAR